MTLTQNTINRVFNRINHDLDRAETLYTRIALRGGTRGEDGIYSALRHPDCRDAAQFIFFEAAAEFEYFCVEAFRIEVRYEFKLQPKKAAYVMGDIDRGLGRVMGWASPKFLMSRGRALHGKRGFLPGWTSV